MNTELQSLPATSHLRIIPVENGQVADKTTPLVAVLREMLSQWQQKGSIKAGAVALLEGGAFIAIGYAPAAGDVSGCTKDQLTHTVLDFEQQLGIRMISAPNLAVELEGAVRLLDRDEFRRLRADGTITEATVVFDHLVDNVGSLGNFRTTVGESWYNRVGRPKAPIA